MCRPHKPRPTPLSGRTFFLHWACAALALVLPGPAGSYDGPTFTDVTADAGINHVQHDLWGDPPTIPPDSRETTWMSGGAAVADYDGDGWTDIFFSRLDAPDVLYRNLGNGTFEDVTTAAGLDADLQTNGAAWGDIDNDGDPDLYLTGLLELRHFLYVNDGHGHFSEEAILRGADIASTDEHYSYSAAFGDYDNDGWIDLHTDEWGGLGNVHHSRLLRNRGEEMPGHFTDETIAAGLDFNDYPGFFGNRIWAFASRFSDLDGDGWVDLAVAGDFGTSRLFWNNQDGTFSDGTDAAGVGSDENGMGSAIGDFDGDGLLDWFVTSIFDPDDTCATESCIWGTTGNRLYHNEGGRSFSDATDSAGVRDGGWGWGAAFFDYDNDGDLDLSMANGQMFLGPGGLEEPFEMNPARLWRNEGAGPMTEVAAEAGVAHVGPGKGILSFDYDRDGDLDLLLVNNGGTPVLYRNDGGNERNWLRVRVLGRRSNRDGLGARVLVTAEEGGPTQVREISGGSHFLGQSERVAHFGLGTSESVRVHRVRVEWPTGIFMGFGNVPVNQTLVITEPPPYCGLTGFEWVALAYFVSLARRRTPRIR